MVNKGRSREGSAGKVDRVGEVGEVREGMESEECNRGRYRNGVGCKEGNHEMEWDVGEIKRSERKQEEVRGGKQGNCS